MQVFEDQKISIINSTIKANRCTIIGTGNTIYGNDNKIIGTGNTIYGNDNKIIGPGNTIYGNDNKIIGPGNTIHGNGNEGIGPGNTGYEDGTISRMKNRNANRNTYDSGGVVNRTIIQGPDFSGSTFKCPINYVQGNGKNNIDTFRNNSLIIGDGETVIFNEDTFTIKQKTFGIDTKLVELPDCMKEEVYENIPDETNACTKCKQRMRMTIQIPCNHSLHCVTCARDLYLRKMQGEATCVYCKEAIKKIVLIPKNE